ncbi:TfoX/Sxy family protein [Chitinispirillales bacterium ANBcel5]|uniref:TfoX/Sxy family protein n=1 Tax=Cellulosispirillum alkaliphilum TaxID=3039283 RepID=UPI002A550A76|nr:TfoX/Sxy family protein [Chitinispirillales bacterium ANBcel5]
MSSSIDFVEFVTDQLKNAGTVTYKKMFGEYALYCDGKVVGLICNSQFFLKPTAGGEAFIGKVTKSPPYEGSKEYFLMDDMIEDRDRISQLVSITARELPAPKKKSSKTKRSKK